MKTNDVFPSKYLKAEDDAFENGDMTATIKDVVKEQLGQGKDEKPVMYFREFAKGLVVNKTNWATCDKLFASDDSDDWIGQKVACISPKLIHLVMWSRQSASAPRSQSINRH